ncbi:MAG: Bax inhibitor-1 family protein [Solirubrobacteraceae bacterium]
MPIQQDGHTLGSGTLTRDQTHSVFGQVMGLVALTVGCTALGAYVGRNMNGSAGIFFFLGAFACIFGLQFASSRGREQLAVLLLFGLGLLLGLAVSPIIVYYAKADPGALYQAAASTALFVGILGSVGYATRRDLSSWARTLFWALLALLVFGLIATFVAIPGANIIYCVLGLVLFGFFTVFDFNRLRRANQYMAVPIAASIFLDIFNVFLFLLRIFGGGGRS